MSVNPVEAIGAVDTYTTYFTRPSQDASSQRDQTTTSVTA